MGRSIFQTAFLLMGVVTQVFFVEAAFGNENLCRWLTGTDQGFDFRLTSVGKDTVLGDIMRPDGEILLFRKIRGRYQRNFRRGFYAESEGGYSYSPYPADFFMAASAVIPPGGTIHSGIQNQMEMPAVIIASQQNVFRDGLFENAVGRPRLSPDSPIPSYNEVKVPLDRESPLFTVPVETYLSILKEMRNKVPPPTLNQFMERLLSSSGIEFIH